MKTRGFLSLVAAQDNIGEAILDRHFIYCADRMAECIDTHAVWFVDLRWIEKVDLI